MLRLKRSFNYATLLFAFMFALACFLGASQEAKAQAAVCPGAQGVDTGWVSVVFDEGSADFSGALLGTYDLLPSGAVVGGLDWFWRDQPFVEFLDIVNDDDEIGGADEDFDDPDLDDPLFGDPLRGLETNLVGGQLISWWTQANGRRTFLQVTNVATPEYHITRLGDEILFLLGIVPNLSVHVEFFDASCTKVLDFCDSYTPKDTHIYDLANIVKNVGTPVNSALLQGNEGFVTITPVVDCDGRDRRAIEFQTLMGNLEVLDTDRANFDYGTNVYARRAVAIDYEDYGGDVDGSGEIDEQEDPEPCDAPDGDGGFIVNGDGCCTEQAGGFDGGALILDGGKNCRFEPNRAFEFQQQFNVVPGSIASRSDVVFINFNDAYNFLSPAVGYRATPATVNLFPFCFDANEDEVSQTNFEVCFARRGLLGATDPLPGSDEPLPTPTPTPTPSPTPTEEPSPSPSPTATGGGGGGGCAIAGPVELGTAAANVLIPLIPALGIGVRMLARRKRSEKK
ncbi:MAG: hypothetical protein QXI19_01190 [Candidatus Caldarchaeum sp.]